MPELWWVMMSVKLFEKRKKKVSGSPQELARNQEGVKVILMPVICVTFRWCHKPQDPKLLLCDSQSAVGRYFLKAAAFVYSVAWVWCGSVVFYPLLCPPLFCPLSFTLSLSLFLVSWLQPSTRGCWLHSQFQLHGGLPSCQMGEGLSWCRWF